MRIRWLHVALIVSLLANVGLAVGWELPGFQTSTVRAAMIAEMTMRARRIQGQMRRGRVACARIVYPYPNTDRIAPTMTARAARTPREMPAHMAWVRASL